MTASAGLDGWTESFPGPPALRRLEHPIPVEVDMSLALPGDSGFTRADQLPLRVRAGCIRIEATMSGTLYHWLRVADGRWLAQVCVPVASANGHSRLDLWLWVDAGTVSQQPDDPIRREA
ncbi:hypothetical protein GS481_02835 [Rhodococcus hoagii]|nr:hypothetical protein [Prescottella equi]